VSTKREEVRKEWQRHIIAAKHGHRSVADYCQEHKISIASFYSWRRKLQSDLENGFVAGAINPFSRLEVIKDATLNLPDAKWLADFIRHLSIGGEQ